MRRVWILAALVAVTAGVAGCIGDEAGPAGDADDGGPAEDGQAFVPPEPEEDFHNRLPVDHPDHQNPEAHTQGIGLEMVGHTDFADLYQADQQAGWTEVDIRGHLAAIASYNDNVGVAIANLSDPANPEPVAVIGSAGVDQDARLSEDAEYLFLACQSSERTDTGGLAGSCRSSEPSATTDEPASGVVAYDVSTPSEPEYAGFLGGVNTHNIWSTTIDGEIYVFTNGVEILHFDPGAEPDSALEKVAEVPGGHDAFVAEHPVTGEQTLYTTKGNTFAIFNVSDPANPQVLTEKGPEVTGWHEQTASTALVDGRALLVVGGEVFADEAGTYDGSDPPMISVLDVTDPTAPEVRSQWTLPVDDLPPWSNYRWSPHNIDVTPHGQVAVAWNHGGLWVFDVSTQERQSEPVTVGFYQPHEMPPTQLPTAKPTGDVSVPRVWGGMFDHHGYVVTADMYTGLYVLEPRWGLYG
jgi:hypothetical protein